MEDPDKKPMGTVMQGLRLTLEDSRFEVLLPRLNEIDTEWRGFAYEGVGIGFAVFDSLWPRGKRLPALIGKTEDTYVISTYIGAGMALAMLGNKRPERFLAKQDRPVFRWMIMNGYGFFKGFFFRRRYIAGQAVVKHLSDYGRRIVDQGLGRAIWFTHLGNIEQIAGTIGTFPEARRADLWNGIGFTCAYAGSPLGRQACERLWEQAGPYRMQLAVAGALAAQRRHGSGYLPAYTDQACQVFCGLSGEAAARVANTALENLPTENVDLQHKIWRERIETYFVPRLAGVEPIHAQTGSVYRVSTTQPDPV